MGIGFGVAAHANERSLVTDPTQLPARLLVKDLEAALAAGFEMRGVAVVRGRDILRALHVTAARAEERGR